MEEKKDKFQEELIEDAGFEIIRSNERDNLPKASNIFKEIAKKSGPLIVYYLAPSLEEILQTYLFSQFGIPSLAASNLISTTQQFVIDPISSLPDQSAVLVAEVFGKIQELQGQQNIQNDIEEGLDEATSQEIAILNKKIGDILRQAYGLGGLASIPCIIALLSLRYSLPLLGVSKDVSDIVSQYFIPVVPAIPFMMAVNINERVLSAVNQENWLIPYKLFTAGLNISLSLLLTPRLGETGAGLVVLIGMGAAFLVSTSLIIFKEGLKPFDLLNIRHHSGNYFKPLLKQGLPASLYSLISSGSTFTLTIFLSNLGSLQLSIEAMTRIFWIPNMIAYGVSQATNRLIAQSLGKKDYLRISQYGKVGLLTSTLIFSSLALMCNAFSLNIASLFMETEKIKDAEDMIRVNFILVSLIHLFAVAVDSTGLSLSAIEDTLLASLTGIVTTLAIILPLSAISDFLMNFDIYGINGSLGIGFFTAAVVSMIYGLKTSNKMVKENDFDPVHETSNVKFFALCSSFSFFKECFRNENQEIGDLEKLSDQHGSLSPIFSPAGKITRLDF